MLFSDLKKKIKDEINLQFSCIINWTSIIWEVQDITIPEQVIQRKNFLIVWIYSANEYILESAIDFFYSELYDAIWKETGNNLWIKSEKLKIDACVSGNHNGTIDGIEKMLWSIIGSSHARKVLEAIKSSMGNNYSVFLKELSDFKKHRDKQAHSSINFFSNDFTWIAVDIDNARINLRINNLSVLFQEFCDHLYDELNKLYGLP